MNWFFNLSVLLIFSVCSFQSTAESPFNGTQVADSYEMEAHYEEPNPSRKDACCAEDRHRPVEWAQEKSEEESRRVVNSWLPSSSRPLPPAPASGRR